MTLIRSALYFVFLSLSTIAYTLPLILLGRWLPYDKRCGIANAWGLSNLKALQHICRLGHTIQGLEQLPSHNCIIMSKHQSAWETIALRGLLPPQQSWVLKQELLSVPFFGLGLKAVEPIAIDRSAGRKAIKQIIDDGIAALQQGRWVVIFPEGTRVAPGQRKKYGAGGALLAEKSGYPVIPIAHNAGLFWSRRSIRKYPGTIQMEIGPPITTVGKKASQINQEIEQWIESAMARLPTSR
jgi:1-acyl-sn-glycerol-3-phosphate acyltransferase